MYKSTMRKRVVTLAFVVLTLAIAGLGYLRELENAAGFKFVERAPGGNPRSGMRLTARGSEFLACYGKFQRGLEQAAARHFERSFKGSGVSARVRPSGSPGSRARSARASGEAG